MATSIALIGVSTLHQQICANKKTTTTNLLHYYRIFVFLYVSPLSISNSLSRSLSLWLSSSIALFLFSHTVCNLFCLHNHSMFLFMSSNLCDIYLKVDFFPFFAVVVVVVIVSMEWQFICKAYHLFRCLKLRNEHRWQITLSRKLRIIYLSELNSSRAHSAFFFFYQNVIICPPRLLGISSTTFFLLAKSNKELRFR